MSPRETVKYLQRLGRTGFQPVFFYESDESDDETGWKLEPVLPDRWRILDRFPGLLLLNDQYRGKYV